MSLDASQRFSDVRWALTGQTHSPTRDVLWDRPVFHAPPLIVPLLGVSAEPFTRQAFCAPAEKSTRTADSGDGQRHRPAAFRIWARNAGSKQVEGHRRSWRSLLAGALAIAVGR